MYMKTHPNADPNRVKELVQKLSDDNFRDIPCQMHNDVRRETLNTSITNVFDWIETNNPIISGNGTLFKQHSEYLSPAVKMLEKLQNDRARVKKEMYTFDKHSIEYVNRNTKQGGIKVIMNADYGGSGTPLSPFYSPYIPPATTGSAKNLTTTLICCLEFASDNNNQWSKMNNINELFDMIFNVLNTPTDDRELIHDIFTVNDVAQRLISKTNNITMKDVEVIKQYLSTLQPEQLTKLMLAFNIRLVLTRYLTTSVANVMSYLKAHPLDFEHLTEESIYKAGYGVKIPDEIKSDIDYINKTIVDNCLYPFILNDCEIRANNMERVIVCVTDTDSLMVHFASYIDEFQARVDSFRDSCLYASALGLRLFVENVIPKMVSYVVENCNINDPYYRAKFIFKNEFGFLSMALFAKKMYAASMFVQEGNPRDIHDIAVTGLSFKKRDAAEFLEPIMLKLYDKYVLTTNNVDIQGILDEYYALRDRLKGVISTDASYFKVASVKGIGAYDASKVLPDQMRGSILWNELMPDEEILPMDRVIVVPLSFELLQSNQSSDPKIAEVLRLSLIDNEKMKHKPVICLPEYYKVLPEWIQPIVDVDYSIDKLLTPFKQLLGLFDVYIADTDGGMISSRMVYL